MSQGCVKWLYMYVFMYVLVHCLLLEIMRPSHVSVELARFLSLTHSLFFRSGDVIHVKVRVLLVK